MNQEQLPDDVAQAIESGDLEKVSGGYVYNAGAYAGVIAKPWEVVDDNSGDVVGRYETRKEAVEMAKAKGQSQKQIYWNGEDGLWRLRNPNF